MDLAERILTLRRQGFSLVAAGAVLNLNSDEVAHVLRDATYDPPAPGGAPGHVVKDEGVARASRTNLDFVGAGVTVTDDGVGDRSLVTIPGGGGGAPALPVAKFTGNAASKNHLQTHTPTWTEVRDDGARWAPGSVFFSTDNDLECFEAGLYDLLFHLQFPVGAYVVNTITQVDPGSSPSWHTPIDADNPNGNHVHAFVHRRLPLTVGQHVGFNMRHNDASAAKLFEAIEVTIVKLAA